MIISFIYEPCAVHTHSAMTHAWNTHTKKIQITHHNEKFIHLFWFNQKCQNKILHNFIDAVIDILSRLIFYIRYLLQSANLVHTTHAYFINLHLLLLSDAFIIYFFIYSFIDRSIIIYITAYHALHNILCLSNYFISIYIVCLLGFMVNIMYSNHWLSTGRWDQTKNGPQSADSMLRILIKCSIGCH